MTREDKERLSKDLCARLPYGVKICCIGNPKINGHLVGIVGQNVVMFSSGRADFPISDIRPYLRQMSSMTKEETEKYLQLCETDDGDFTGEILYFNTCESFDYLNSIHVDYRNMIENGLALKAPEGMYNTKTE